MKHLRSKKIMAGLLTGILITGSLGTANTFAADNTILSISETSDSNHVKFVSITQNGNTEDWEYYIIKENQSLHMHDTITKTDDTYTITSNIINDSSENYSATFNTETGILTENITTSGETIQTSYSVDEFINDNAMLARSTNVSGTVNLKNTKFVVSVIATVIATSVGESSAGPFGAVAGAIVSRCIDEGLNRCPDSVYYSGTKSVSHSCGRNYNRYNCTFYKNSSKKVSYGSAKWSRRWGH